ncbi:MBL fold metallo-hydrolase [Goodfellowiella coeruleoviolacea]|uniref:Ribonuclease BN, tRNA processing enzyme n=1 Tax=Goodfellowiella coeruleoviolacea TaxID=334858 RepID=A0AAE3GLH6_9PSEU|nr:MBL fold metallo-hydrolase [Goodfellowiella coeruleoviolacea]MCP2170411.1 Ribonuclease BN, tRNA processing enzyme [Goodfellowiella coeruleoviolacea]
MHLTILGCSGSGPGPNQAASGYLVEAAGHRLVVDLGNGTLASLQAHGDPFSVAALLLSHLHPDHCADLTALTVLRRYHPNPPHDPRAHRLPVHAPSEAPTRLAAAYAPSRAELAETDLSDVFDFHPLGPEPISLGPFTVTAAPVAHPCEAYGFRIEHDGQVLAYTGDSGPCAALADLAADADVLLAEASWTHAEDRPEGLHLSGRQAGELAATAGVGRLLVTHVPPWTDADAVLAEARAAFSGPTELVRQGRTYPIAGTADGRGVS